MTMVEKMKDTILWITRGMIEDHNGYATCDSAFDR